MSFFKKFAANLFILFTLMTMVKVHLPMDRKFFQVIYEPITFLERSIGTHQRWFMFAPNPSRTDTYVIGEVEYEDGSKDTFDFHKGIGMSLFDKYRFGERYRKYAAEHLSKESKDFLWEDAARFTVRKLKEKNNYKLPRKVTLTRYWDRMPNWDQKFFKHSEFRKQYQSLTFYSKEP